MESFRYKTALLIDDNAIDNIIHSRIIKLSSFVEEIIIKDSSIEALAFLKLAASNPDMIPDVILLDINMPQVNGFQFLESFAQLPSVVINKTKIIMISSSLDESDMRKAEANQYVHKFICKPLTLEVLTALYI